VKYLLLIVACLSFFLFLPACADGGAKDKSNLSATRERELRTMDRR
jgi:hypothetical protein